MRSAGHHGCRDAANPHRPPLGQTARPDPDAVARQLELLASRFGADSPHNQPDAALRDFLTKRAQDYRTYKAEIEAINERTKGLGNLKAAARDAAENLDFEEVEMLLSRVHKAEVEIASETAELRARNALLRGRVEQAYELLCAAADSFAAIDSLEPARRRLYKYARLLWEHGVRFGGPGFLFTARMIQPLTTELSSDAQKEFFADAHVWLGLVLREQGILSAGPMGVELLGEAVSACRSGLQVYTRSDHPMYWAGIQQNLALTEQAIADHDTTSDLRPHLERALDYVDAALMVFDSEHMPYRHEQATILRDQITSALADL